MNTHRHLLLALALVILASDLLGQALRPYSLVSSKRASGSSAGTIVKALGRLEDSTSGTVVTATIAGNGFIGDDDGTWGKTGTTMPIVQTAQDWFINGLQLSDASGFGDGSSTRFWLHNCNGNDAYPSYTFTASKATVVFGFGLTVSNWNGSTFQGFDTLRVGASPFLIVQFGDNSEGSFLSLLAHSPDGIGSPITIVNNTHYWITGIYRQTGTVEITVYSYSAPATYTLVGTSDITMATGNADHIRFSQNDDHGATTGDILRFDNFCWSYTAGDYPLLPNQ